MKFRVRLEIIHLVNKHQMHNKGMTELENMAKLLDHFAVKKIKLTCLLGKIDYYIC